MAPKGSKPNLTLIQVSELVRHLYGLTDSEIRPLPSYADQNFYVSVKEGGEYVFKVMNSYESKDTDLLELQTYAMHFMQKRGLPVQTAVPTKTGQLMTLQEFDFGYGLQKYLVRLMTYLPGTIIGNTASSPTLLYEVGKMAATMDKLFQEMEFPKESVLQRDTYVWMLSNMPLLEPYLHVMDGHPMQQIFNEVTAQYKAQVVPKMSSFRKCVIHGDFHDLNILVMLDGPSQYKISGILDFADMNSGYYVFELAITIMHMMIANPSLMGVGGYVLAGYESIIPLNEAERDCLFLLVLCRFIQVLVLTHHTKQQDPENEEYLMFMSRTGFQQLNHLWELGKRQVENAWFECAKTYKQQG